MRNFLRNYLLLAILLVTVPVLSQNPTRFAKVQITGNAPSSTATSVNVQEVSGEINTKPLSDFEKTVNKQNSLTTDGTGTKYPTVDAVNSSLSGKADASTTLDINGVSQNLSANRSWRTAQGDTGVLTYAGSTTNSATTINIGAVVGVVANNETNPLIPSYTLVNYAGATGVTVTTVGTGQASYIMLSSAGVISFQNTFPTSTERKAKIWLGKVSHPSGSVTLVIDEPDYITSPMAYSRDLLQALGGYINGGVYPIENGSNLNMNITGGYIMGDGINFTTSKTSPNMLNMGPNIPATFSERTRVGGVTAGVTVHSVGFYDANGDATPDAIPGGGNTSALHYIFAVPGQGYIVQYGQNTYSTLANAIAAIGKETFVKWSNLDNNAILIGVLAAQKNATTLRTQDGQGQFFQANVLGGLIGSTAGVSTATLQSAYNNSVLPQILVDNTRLAVTVRNGQSSDASNIIQGQNISGTTTSSLDGNGKITGTSFVDSNATSTDALLAGGTTLSNPISGSLTSGYLPKATGSTTLGNSLVYDSGTNVGIGTTAPTAKLSVLGGEIKVVSSNFVSGSIGNTLTIGVSQAGDYARVLSGGIGDTAARNLVLQEFGGNVGINTTAPSAKLHVVGLAGSDVLLLEKSTGASLAIAGATGTTNNAILAATNSTSPDFQLFTGGSERMRITNGGNALFGTTTDNGHGVLQANGNITASAATLSGQVVIKSQLDLKSDLASPALTGTPTAPTATAGTNTTQIATTAFVLANSTSIPQLEFNNTDKTVWNNGKANIDSNTSFGPSALKSVTTGGANSAYGEGSMSSNTTGDINSAFGRESLSANISGSSNSSFGYESLFVNTTGGFNCAFGASSMSNNTTGTQNVSIGNSSGSLVSAGSALTNPSLSVFIGYGSRALSDSQTNEIVIGHSAIGAGSNTATLGNTSITKTVLRGVISAAKTYTVATLPTGVLGDSTIVTDALAPTFLGVVVGGGAVVTPVFYNGTNWVAK